MHLCLQDLGRNILQNSGKKIGLRQQFASLLQLIDRRKKGLENKKISKFRQRVLKSENVKTVLKSTIYFCV